VPSFALHKLLGVFQRSSLGIFCSFLLLGLAVFGNAIDHPFVHDDIVFIEENPYITRIDLAEIFTTTSSSSGQKSITNTYWRPLLELVYRLEYKLFRLDPSGYHYINVLIHIVNAYLIYQLIFLIGGKRQLWAWAVAVVFLVHPVQSEAVACISGISNLLFALLCLGSLLTYWKSRTQVGIGAFLGSLVLFLLALLAKEQSAIIPLLIVWVEVCFLRSQKPFPLAKIGSYFVVLLFYLLYRTTYIGSIVSYSLSNNHELWLRLAAFPSTLLTYFRIFFLPTDLHYYRSTDILEPVFIPTLLFAALGVFIVRLVIRTQGANKTLLIFSLGWFAIHLAPTSNILPLINEYSLILSAEHFLYLPIVGITVFLFTALEEPIARYREKTPIFFTILIVACGACTAYQNTFWRGEIPLFTRTLKYENNFGRVHSLLAGAYLFDGQYEKAIESYKRAYGIMKSYRDRTTDARSIKFYRNYMKTIAFNLSHALESLGKFSEAIGWLQKALEIDPRDPILHNNIGLDYIRSNQPTQAEGFFKEALFLDPNFVMAKNNLAILYAMQHRKEEAARLFGEILRQEPQNAAAMQNYQRLLSETKGE